MNWHHLPHVSHKNDSWKRQKKHFFLKSSFVLFCLVSFSIKAYAQVGLYSFSFRYSVRTERTLKIIKLSRYFFFKRYNILGQPTFKILTYLDLHIFPYFSHRSTPWISFAEDTDKATACFDWSSSLCSYWDVGQMIALAHVKSHRMDLEAALALRGGLP